MVVRFMTHELLLRELKDLGGERGKRGKKNLHLWSLTESLTVHTKLKKCTQHKKLIL